MNRPWKLAFLFSFAVLMVLTAATYACPMCKDSIPNSDAPSAGSLASGFNNSINFMLLAFISVVATLAGLIFKAVRDADARPTGFEVVEKDEK